MEYNPKGENGATNTLSASPNQSIIHVKSQLSTTCQGNISKYGNSYEVSHG